MKCGFCAYDRAINFKKITTTIIYCALIMNSSNTSRVFIKCYTDTSIYVDLARMTATIHVQRIFKNILSLGINVLKKKRKKGILIDGGFSKILIPGPERRDLLTF